VDEVVDGLYDLGSITSYTDHAIIKSEASQRFFVCSRHSLATVFNRATFHNRLDCHPSRIFGGIMAFDQVFFYFLFLLH